MQKKANIAHVQASAHLSLYLMASVVLVFKRVSITLAFAGGPSCCGAGVRAGVRLAVVLVFVWVSVLLSCRRLCCHSCGRPSCCLAGVRMGVRPAVVWALYRLSLPFWGVRGCPQVPPKWPKTDRLDNSSTKRQ